MLLVHHWMNIKMTNSLVQTIAIIFHHWMNLNTTVCSVFTISITPADIAADPTLDEYISTQPIPGFRL